MIRSPLANWYARRPLSRPPLQWCKHNIVRLNNWQAVCGKCDQVASGSHAKITLTGSVPVPTSSSSTSDLLFASPRSACNASTPEES